jgi:hypothetical protein
MPVTTAMASAANANLFAAIAVLDDFRFGFDAAALLLLAILVPFPFVLRAVAVAAADPLRGADGSRSVEPAHHL